MYEPEEASSLAIVHKFGDFAGEKGAREGVHAQIIAKEGQNKSTTKACFSRSREEDKAKKG